MPARNAASTIGFQLEALARQDMARPWELIVVDNGSTDETVAITQRWSRSLPSLRVVACDAAGGNRARNAGVRAARADRLLFCDADDVVSAHWVREMSAALDSFDLVGGALDYARLNTAFLQGTRTPLGATELPLGVGHLRYALGSNLGCHRGVFEAIGGFDEAFLNGADEIDFSWRAQYEGFVLGFVPTAVVHYRVRATLGAATRQAFSYAQGGAQLCSKHRALGCLDLTVVDQVKGAIRPLQSLVRVYWLMERRHRWLYAHRAATFAGSIWGLARCEVIPRKDSSPAGNG